MARGFIYEVAKDPALLNDVSAAYFCEDTDLIGCDFVSDEINADECIHDLLRWLERFGFKVDFRKKFFHIDPKSKPTIYGISCTYTMDHWIRAAETGTYFIGGVVLMH